MDIYQPKGKTWMRTQGCAWLRHDPEDDRVLGSHRERHRGPPDVTSR